ncbi:hypothetical protein TNCT_432621 [Trichonephila clavata]|uniref:Uncharacterized protein n=1 Tax=Trichonephila clavata TaxID=2740835 RepID=A0A8X6HR09_TRICU|nr:hypothetical protein TNCT_432621 [Trichonephila clavata]
MSVVCARIRKLSLSSVAFRRALEAVEQIRMFGEWKATRGKQSAQAHRGASERGDRPGHHHGHFHCHGVAEGHLSLPENIQEPQTLR